MTITLDDFIAKLPMPLIHATIQEHIFPLLQLMPDQRLKKSNRGDGAWHFGRGDAGNHGNCAAE